MCVCVRVCNKYLHYCLLIYIIYIYKLINNNVDIYYAHARMHTHTYIYIYTNIHKYIHIHVYNRFIQLHVN